MRRTPVMICDDHPLMSHGLRSLLKPNYFVVGVVNDGREVVSEIGKHQPEILLLDLSIRARSEGRRSLDDVMRHLWRAYGAAEGGVPETGVEALFAEATGVDVSDLLDRCVRSTDPLPYESALGLAGFGVVCRCAQQQ